MIVSPSRLVQDPVTVVYESIHRDVKVFAHSFLFPDSQFPNIQLSDEISNNIAESILRLFHVRNDPSIVPSRNISIELITNRTSLKKYRTSGPRPKYKQGSALQVPEPLNKPETEDPNAIFDRGGLTMHTTLHPTLVQREDRSFTVSTGLTIKHKHNTREHKQKTHNTATIMRDE